ncbi:hypothetical protein CPB85DRAFT_1312038 [Mucidula mucida]|nr:hypothetical protein CPB85DRAFT_1312038 [Mucidula mucida]
MCIVIEFLFGLFLAVRLFLSWRLLLRRRLFPLGFGGYKIVVVVVRGNTVFFVFLLGQTRLSRFRGSFGRCRYLLGQGRYFFVVAGHNDRFLAFRGRFGVILWAWLDPLRRRLLLVARHEHRLRPLHRRLGRWRWRVVVIVADVDNFARLGRRLFLRWRIVIVSILDLSLDSIRLLALRRLCLRRRADFRLAAAAEKGANIDPARRRRFLRL